MTRLLRYTGPSYIPSLVSLPPEQIQDAARSAKYPGEIAARILEARAQFSNGVAATLTGELWPKLSGTPTGGELLFRLIGFAARRHRCDADVGAEKIGRDLMTTKEERDRFASLKEGKTHVVLFTRDQDRAKRWFADQTDTYAANISPCGYKLRTVTLPTSALIAAKLIQPDRFEILLAPNALKGADVITEAF